MSIIIIIIIIYNLGCPPPEQDRYRAQKIVLFANIIVVFLITFYMMTELKIVYLLRVFGRMP